MIISWLTGGLGNQMFQYAAGLALAERRRTILKLDPSWFREYPEHEAHNRYALSCLNVTEQFATEEDIDRVRGIPLTRVERWSVALARRLRFYRYARRHTSAGHMFQAAHPSRFCPEFLDMPDPCYLSGMWQSERFFAPVANLVRQHFSFRYPPTPPVAEMAARIHSGPSAAVHFRRGDYVGNPTFSRELGALGLPYYRAAVELVRSRHPQATLYIFSDDIEAVEREFDPPGPRVFVRSVEHWNAHDTIRLMSLCDHAIVSNSTFAWWGAWLNPNPAKLVIAPDPWRSGPTAEGDETIPQSWTRLPRSG